MVGHVAQRRAVRRRLIADDQVAGVVPGEGDRHIERAGEAHLAVRADVVQAQAVLTLALDGLGLPHALVEADRAAVQVVFAVVAAELIAHAVDLKLTLGDAVAVAADGVAHAAVADEIAVDRVKAEGDVGELAVPVRHEDGLDDSAVIKDAHGRAGAVGHRVAGDGLPGLVLAKGRFYDGHGNVLLTKYRYLYCIRAHGDVKRRFSRCGEKKMRKKYQTYD